MIEAEQRFVVRVAPLERAFSVRSGQAVLAAALDAGLNLPHSCKSGHCASCRARLLRGAIAYPRPYPQGRPPGLSALEAEQGYVLLCQAHALTDLEVEVRFVPRVHVAEPRNLPCRIER